MTRPPESIDSIDRMRSRPRPEGIASILSTTPQDETAHWVAPDLTREDLSLLAAIDRLEAIERECSQGAPTCHACRGADFWSSPYRHHICRRCHAPAPGAEVTS